ncbi:hypothetical protein V5T82_11010 [Magnetovibrio sp. PR-2]|uniref:hypothetical protein n=1 Tax=Magnetovibrio sp. PR-2 TaxID=3120356 RepID=UPI002FCE0004
MPRTRIIANPLPEKDIIAFGSAEEAWFWFIRSERARMEGARLSRDASDTTRPCEPDDIYRAVMRLHQKRVIGRHHLKTLARFGWRECPPDSRVRQEQYDVQLWDDALDRLTTELKAKGIVEHEQNTGQSA